MNKPIIKDKAISAYVKTIEERLSVFEKSPISASYLTIYNQINDWNEQLTIGQEEEKLVDEIKIKVTPGKIDLFADKDEKVFDRAFKYFEKILVMNKTLQELRGLMTEKEKSEIDEQFKAADTSILEKYVKRTSNATT